MQYGIVIPNIGPYADSFWLIDRACKAEERGWDGVYPEKSMRMRCSQCIFFGS
jgi:hypothetical protein